MVIVICHETATMNLALKNSLQEVKIKHLSKTMNALGKHLRIYKYDL